MSLHVIIMAIAETQETRHFSSDKLEKDCYSRAFFLTGKITRERPLQRREVVQFLKDCDAVSQPEVGDLAWIVCHDKQHLVECEIWGENKDGDRLAVGGATVILPSRS